MAKKKRHRIPPFWQVCAIAFGAWVVVAFAPYVFHYFGAKEPQDIGGAAAYPESLFSGLAFAGVIYAIFLQRQELRLQRRELKLTRAELKMTRDEMKRSADAQSKSEEALSKQAISLFNAAYLNALDSLHRMCKANNLSIPLGRLRRASIIQANLEAIVETLGKQVVTDPVQIVIRSHEIETVELLLAFLKTEPATQDMDSLHEQHIERLETLTSYFDTLPDSEQVKLLPVIRPAYAAEKALSEFVTSQMAETAESFEKAVKCIDLLTVAVQEWLGHHL